MEFELYSRSSEIISMKKALSEITGVDLGDNPLFDKQSQDVLHKYQIRQGIVESSRFGAVYGPQSQLALGSYIMENFITDETIASAANELGIQTHVLMIIDEFCKQKPFFFTDTDNCKNPSIIFQKIKFYRLLKDRHAELVQKLPPLFELNDKFDGMCNEKKNLWFCVDIHKDAFECGRYGAYEIDGSIWTELGLGTAEELYYACALNEKSQFDLWVRYLKHREDLIHLLRIQCWDGFCRKYWEHHAAVVLARGIIDKLSQFK